MDKWRIAARVVPYLRTGPAEVGLQPLVHLIYILDEVRIWTLARHPDISRGSSRQGKQFRGGLTCDRAGRNRRPHLITSRLSAAFSPDSSGADLSMHQVLIPDSHQASMTLATMSSLTIASVQFECASGDKEANLSTIKRLAKEAARKGAKVVAFHECSISGYTFARHLSKQQLQGIAEPVPNGPSCIELSTIAASLEITILAGLFEVEQGKIYNTYVCANSTGVVAKYRKLHPFISPHLSPGDSYVVFDLYGWKCGILICYDNNIVENVRATALLGAEIIFMPHVTMCTPSTRPGSGFVDPQLWHIRSTNPTSLRAEFDGLKGRQWLLKWLPARAYDNAVYVVFSNPIGMDDDQLKNGCSMILDPFGDILTECRNLGEDMALAVCVRDKLTRAGGHRYRNARRVELYREILGKPHTSSQQVAWLDDTTAKEAS